MTNEEIPQPRTKDILGEYCKIISPPPKPLSDNELRDMYARLCYFPIYLKEHLRREFGWTESQFTGFVLPLLNGRNMRPIEEEIETALVIIKEQLFLLLRYLDISPGLISILNSGTNGKSL